MCFLVNAEDRVLVSTLVRVIPAPKEARSPRLGQFSLERRLVIGDMIESHLQSGACLGNRNDTILAFPETQGGNSFINRRKQRLEPELGVPFTVFKGGPPTGIVKTVL